MKSDRWCPRCERRCSAESFTLLFDLAYLDRRRARVYEHVPCDAIVIAVLAIE
jgi:hypothetical protein